MNVDFLYLNDGSTTYTEDKKECLNITGNSKRYFRIENRVIEAESYKVLCSQYEIRTLDENTKLRELKCSKIRVIHFTYENDTFVYLGTFIKETKKTPQNIIDKNNKRIERYMEQKRGNNNE